jgi:hypothetical protein
LTAAIKGCLQGFCTETPAWASQLMPLDERHQHTLGAQQCWRPLAFPLPALQAGFSTTEP